MANDRKTHKGNRKNTRGRRKQEVLSAPGRIFVERYITDHMLEKAIKSGLSKKEAIEKYGKNRYKPNPEAKIVKVIYHTK